MKNSNKSLLTGANVALISIHPEYAEKILSGDKRLEFRRTWAAKPIDILVIYATAPIQRIVGVAKIGQVFKGSKTKLWELGRQYGSGISRRKLFAYLEGKPSAVAIEIQQCHPFEEMLDPRGLFDANFKPPQSFCYLSPQRIKRLNNFTKGMTWA